MKEIEVPGAAVVIVKDGEVVYLKGVRRPREGKAGEGHAGHGVPDRVVLEGVHRHRSSRCSPTRAS